MKNDQTSLIEALGIADMPAKAQKEVLQKAEQQLEDVLVRFFVENLSDSEVKRLNQLIKGGANIDEKVANAAASIPLLAERLEMAITQEIVRLRAVLAD